MKLDEEIIQHKKSPSMIEPISNFKSKSNDKEFSVVWKFSFFIEFKIFISQPLLHGEELKHLITGFIFLSKTGSLCSLQ